MQQLEFNNEGEIFKLLKEKNISLKDIKEQQCFASTIKAIRILKKNPELFDTMPAQLSWQMKYDISGIIKNKGSK